VDVNQCSVEGGGVADDCVCERGIRVQSGVSCVSDRCCLSWLMYQVGYFSENRIKLG
jgi:hypothetical protein